VTAVATAAARRPAGLVYLLHFDQLYVPYPGAPLRDCAGHYTGRVFGGPQSLKRRLAQHGTPDGARLMFVIRQAGITWQLARTWPGRGKRERQLKNQGGASRRCPLCGVTPRVGELPRGINGSVARSLATDRQLAAAGLMTAVQLSEHTALRRGLVTGKPARPATRGPLLADPWAITSPELPGPAAVIRTARAGQAAFTMPEHHPHGVALLEEAGT
jgi:hypothetical protein